jgi:predicted regulator of Ras-like GTPase activity (Roadblock/LC7/MglB family)
VTDSANSDLRWVLDNFVDKVPGMSHVILASADGLPMAASEGFPSDQVDRLSAIAAGLTSMTQGAADCFKAGAVHQVVVEMEQGYLFVMSVGDGSRLAALASTSADLGLVGYEMALLVSRVGPVLTPAARAPGPVSEPH